MSATAAGESGWTAPQRCTPSIIPGAPARGHRFGGVRPGEHARVVLERDLPGLVHRVRLGERHQDASGLRAALRLIAEPGSAPPRSAGYLRAAYQSTSICV